MTAGRQPTSDERKRDSLRRERAKCPECGQFTLYKVIDRRFKDDFKWECSNCDRA